MTQKTQSVNSKQDKADSTSTMKKQKVIADIGKVLEKHGARIMSIVVPEQIVVNGVPHILSFKSESIVILEDELPQDNATTKGE